MFLAGFIFLFLLTVAASEVSRSDVNSAFFGFEYASSSVSVQMQ